jgi:hypothetical protein
MTEFAGPCEHSCPERIFKLLSILNDTNDPNGWAREWRKKVQEQINRSIEASKANAEGKIYIMEKPICFRNGSEYMYFQKEGRRMYAGYLNGKDFTKVLQVRFNPARSSYKYELI